MTADETLRELRRLEVLAAVERRMKDDRWQRLAAIGREILERARLR